MLKNYLQADISVRKKIFVSTTIVALMTGFALALWTGLTQHQSVQQRERLKLMDQLAVAIGSLLRDQPGALRPWNDQTIMIGRVQTVTTCPSLQRDITVVPAVEQIVSPYLRKMYYDTDMASAKFSGWYLDVTEGRVTLGSCLTAVKTVELNY